MTETQHSENDNQIGTQIINNLINLLIYKFDRFNIIKYFTHSKI